MMKKEFIDPEIEVVRFNASDIILTSTGGTSKQLSETVNDPNYTEGTEEWFSSVDN